MLVLFLLKFPSLLSPKIFEFILILFRKIFTKKNSNCMKYLHQFFLSIRKIAEVKCLNFPPKFKFFLVNNLSRKNINMEQTSKVSEFDSYLGGTENVPSFVNMSEFVKHRLEEVVMLTEAVKESPFRGQAFQRLPKHMRRRQMSHYIKRLPRRLQKPYLMSLKEAPPAPTKRPSRKFRRRPGNLLLEYNRRQRNSVWLETHIWHAKRFHLTKKWGYRLPEKPVNKSFKACYRAASEHCLLVDVSYYNCIELKGSEEVLLNGLRKCTSTDCGLTFAAKTYLSGTREGLCMLFHPESYPHGAIGNVTFMWQPVVGKERKIWIWVHPLLHSEVIKCFSELFDLVLVNDEQLGKEKTNGVEEIKLQPRNVPFIKTPKYSSKNNSVTMSLLKDTLNRFQLTGPLSQAVVAQAFHVASIHTDDGEVLEVKSKRRKLDEDEEEEKKKETNWWEDYYNSENGKNWESQKQFYSKLSEFVRPEDVSPGMILSLVIEDPRLGIPSKREKAVPKIKSAAQMTLNAIDVKISQSPIWIPEIRDEVSLTKLTTHEINEARSKKIVPGFGVGDIIPDKKQSRIPILLVQRPGSCSGKLGFGSGWDIISPAGFGMPIWLSLIFRGARSGGLRESELLLFERNSLKGFLQPDSAAGESQNQFDYEQHRSRHFRLPPNKRPNFVKLGISSPFYYPWKILIKDWILKKGGGETQKEFCILRDEKTLKDLAESVLKFPKNQNFSKFSTLNPHYLLPVMVECQGRGKPNDFAVICIPEDIDMKNTKSGPAEPSHKDENENVRKTTKSEHRKLLKSLRRKRKKDRMKLKEDFANNLPNKLKWKDILKTNTAPSEMHAKEYKSKMEGLWLPEIDKVTSVVNSGSRSVMGFVTKGGFSFSKSCGLGLGYVTLPGLVELLSVCERNKSKAVVLVRNINEVQYNFAKLSIAVE